MGVAAAHTRFFATIVRQRAREAQSPLASRRREASPGAEGPGAILLSRRRAVVLTAAPAAPVSRGGGEGEEEEQEGAWINGLTRSKEVLCRLDAQACCVPLGCVGQ